MGDIRKIYRSLQDLNAEHGELILAGTPKKEEQTKRQFEEFKEQARNAAFQVTVTIVGDGNRRTVGSDESIFASETLPDSIDMIYMTNINSYRQFDGRLPVEQFELTIDFSRPPLLDPNTIISGPTPNDSNLKVQGVKTSWVAATIEVVNSVFKARANHRGFLHRAFVYDIGLMIFGLPAALYVAWKASGLIDKHVGSWSAFLEAVAYVYIILLVIWVYRALYGYTKWAFPSVELKDNKHSSSTHRKIWSAIILGLATKFLFEILW